MSSTSYKQLTSLAKFGGREKYANVSLKTIHLDPNSEIDPELRLGLFLMGAENMTEGMIREAIWPTSFPDLEDEG